MSSVIGSNCELSCCDISDVHNLIAVGTTLVCKILLYFLVECHVESEVYSGH